MRDISVKLQCVDLNPKYTYRTRIIKIKVGSKSLKTPIRAITNTEMNAKKNIPTPISINSEIGEVSIKLTKNKIDKFVSENRYYNNILKKINSYLAMMQYNSLNFVLLQPTCELSEKVKEKFSRLQLQLQKDLDNYPLQILVMPWLNLPLSEFKRMHLEYVKNNSEYTIIPIVNPNVNINLLKKILEYLVSYVDTGELPFLGLLYRALKSYRVSYDYIWEYINDKDVGIIFFDVERRFRDLLNISGHHYLEFQIGDIFGSRVYTGGYRKNGKKYPIEKEIKLFDRDNLTVIELYDFINKYNDWIGKIVCECNEELFKIPLKNYKEAETDNDKRTILSSISKVHEFIVSREEFIQSQKYIIDEDSISYIQQKKTLFKLYSQKRLD